MKKISCCEQQGKEAGNFRYILAVFLLISFLSAQGHSCSAATGILWKGYREGLAQAGRESKPAIIIFYSETCSTCKQYKGVLQDKRLIQASAAFVMIRVNTRQHPQLSAKYQFDGWYVPRTFAVFPDGRTMQQLYPRKKYRYFIGLEPENLLNLMQKALAEMKH